MYFHTNCITRHKKGNKKRGDKWADEGFKDELVEFFDHGMTVVNAGKGFNRNLCLKSRRFVTGMIERCKNTIFERGTVAVAEAQIDFNKE